MFYSAYDLQHKKYFKTGRNSRNRTTCVSRIRDHLTEGSELANEEYEDIPDDELLEMFDVRIDEHSRPIGQEEPLTGLS